MRHLNLSGDKPQRSIILKYLLKRPFKWPSYHLLRMTIFSSLGFHSYPLEYLVCHIVFLWQPAFLPSLFIISVSSHLQSHLMANYVIVHPSCTPQNCIMGELLWDIKGPASSLPSTANGIVTTSQEFNVLHLSHFNMKCDIWIWWFFTASLVISTENRAQSRALEFRAWTISSKYEELVSISGTLRCGWYWLRCHFSSRTLTY